MKSYLIRHSILSVCLAVILFVYLPGIDALKDIQSAVWLSYAFLNALFLLVFFLIDKSLRMESQQYFMQFFAATFGIKFFASLVWVLYFAFAKGIRSQAFILVFFGMYFTFTFLLMAEVWLRTKRIVKK